MLCLLYADRTSQSMQTSKQPEIQQTISITTCRRTCKLHMSARLPDSVVELDLLTYAAVPDDVNPIPESAGFVSQQLSQPEDSPSAPQLVLPKCTAACLQLEVTLPAFCNPCNDFSLLPPTPCCTPHWLARLPGRQGSMKGCVMRAEGYSSTALSSTSTLLLLLLLSLPVC